MNKRKGKVSKIMWLSLDKFVFESPFEIDYGTDDFYGFGMIGKKKMLVLAERNQHLRFLPDNNYMADELCWFCENAISPQLLNRGDVPTCLLGKACGWVKFCEDFVPGPNFGEDKQKDIGERRIMAEKILSKIRLEKCYYCQHWKTETIVKTSASGGIDYVSTDYCETFREIREKPYDWKTPCRNFEISQDPFTKTSFEQQKRQLPEYIQALKIAESSNKVTHKH